MSPSTRERIAESIGWWRAYASEAEQRIRRAEQEIELARESLAEAEREIAEREQELRRGRAA